MLTTAAMTGFSAGPPARWGHRALSLGYPVWSAERRCAIRDRRVPGRNLDYPRHGTERTAIPLANALPPSRDCRIQRSDRDRDVLAPAEPSLNLPETRVTAEQPGYPTRGEAAHRPAASPAQDRHAHLLTPFRFKIGLRRALRKRVETMERQLWL